MSEILARIVRFQALLSVLCTNAKSWFTNAYFHTIATRPFQEILSNTACTLYTPKFQVPLLQHNVWKVRNIYQMSSSLSNKYTKRTTKGTSCKKKMLPSAILIFANLFVEQLFVIIMQFCIHSWLKN